MKFDMCREKQKVTKGVYRRSHVRQELRSCVRSRISPAINGVQSAVVLHGFAFVVYFFVCVFFFFLTSRAALVLNSLQSTYLCRRQTGCCSTATSARAADCSKPLCSG